MPNGGRGYRRMYQLTGVPGWMRFGYSPGWLGRSPTGLGPAASYLMTGQWPTPQAQYYGPQTSQEQELDALKEQADMVRKHLEKVEARVRKLEGKPED